MGDVFLNWKKERSFAHSSLYHSFFYEDHRSFSSFRLVLLFYENHIWFKGERRIFRYVYIYIYIHTYIYTHTHIYVYTHTHTHTHICVYIYIYFREGNGTPLQYSCLENPMDGGAWWAAVHGVTKSRTRLSDFTFTFHFHALEKEMAAHSSVLAWRIPGTGEPGGLPSVGSHRVGHD